MPALSRVRKHRLALTAAVAVAMAASTFSGPSASAGAGRPDPVDPTKPSIVVAQASPGNRFHFPSAFRLSNGTILLVAREGVSHSDPSGRLVLTSSSDHAKTWSAPHVVLDSPGDDRDPMISQSSTGRVFLNWFTSDPGKVGAQIGAFVAYSDDNGSTWSDPVRIGTAMDGTDSAGRTGWAASHGQLAEAPDGTLLAPLYGKFPQDPTFFRLSVVRSTDGGRTWPAENEVFLPTPGNGAAEPVLTVLRDGTITALLRRDNYPSQLTRSTDNGRTWSPLEPTSLMTSSADTLVLRNGDVFVAYGDLSHRFGQRRLTAAAVIKHPERPWRVAATSPVWDAFVDDQANPSIVEAGPGRVLVFGFDYSSRSLVASYVDVDSVGARTDTRQLAGRLDLTALVRAGEASVESDLSNPLAAIDGVLGLGSGAQGTPAQTGTYTVTFTRPRRIREVGVALRPGEAQSGQVEVLTGSGWTVVGELPEQWRYGDVDWLGVAGRDQHVTAIRLTTKPMTGPRPPNSGAPKPIVVTELALRGHAS